MVVFYWYIWSSILHNWSNEHPCTIIPYGPNLIGYEECIRNAKAGDAEAQSLIAKYIAMRITS